MAVEPADEGLQFAIERFAPAVFFALGHEQLAWHAGFFQLGLKHLPL